MEGDKQDGQRVTIRQWKGQGKNILHYVAPSSAYKISRMIPLAEILTKPMRHNHLISAGWYFDGRILNDFCFFRTSITQEQFF